MGRDRGAGWGGVGAGRGGTGGQGAVGEDEHGASVLLVSGRRASDGVASSGFHIGDVGVKINIKPNGGTFDVNV